VELPARPTGTPTVEQIIVAAGWGSPALCGQYGITNRYPLARYKTEESAKIATTALQGRVSELARSTETKERWSDSDSLLATANPHFIAVPESSLCSAEKAAFREKIERVSKSAGQHPSLEEGLLRFYLPELRGTLEQTQESDLPTTKQGTSQPSIHYLGERNFRVDNGAVWCVSEREAWLLQAFIGKPALDVPQLATISGLDAIVIPTVVRNLRSKTKYGGAFRDALIPPGGKGRGGYRANVLDARS
jgi:hypothetical protein